MQDELGRGLAVEVLPGGRVVLVGAENPAPVAERAFENRSEAELMLQGIPIRLDLRGGIGGDPWLALEEELRFQYMTEADIDPKTGMPRIVKRRGRMVSLGSRLETFSISGCHVFTNTSKMSCASWSLPAGPQEAGGTCSAAVVFRSQKTYEAALEQGDVSRRPPDPSLWICQSCYAAKGNYMHRQSQYAQVIRMIWLKGIMQLGIEEAAKILGDAVRVHNGNRRRRLKSGEDPRFFRIHDSGDMTLSPNTYLLWCRVAERNPEISFWAPTRMWVFPKFTEMVRNNPPPPNLSLRPSALHVSDKAPSISGFAAGSTAHLKGSDPVRSGIAEWSCPAYEHDGKSCAGAGGPMGERDCRVCWTYRDMTVSYSWH